MPHNWFYRPRCRHTKENPAEGLCRKRATQFLWAPLGWQNPLFVLKPIELRTEPRGFVPWENLGGPRNADAVTGHHGYSDIAVGLGERKRQIVDGRVCAENLGSARSQNSCKHSA